MANELIKMNIRIDGSIVTGVLLLSLFGLFILYSASNQNIHMVIAQAVRFIGAIIFMLILAQLPPERFKQLAPFIYGLGIILLLIVLGMGVVGKGAQRWLNVGLFRFQPSEIMKLGLPLILSWYFSEQTIPPKKKALGIASMLILIPVLLTAKQPDLGTAILMASAGLGVILLAGIQWRIVIAVLILMVALTPVLWHHMHGYQRNRIMTFLNPEQAKLSTGYHIIQSKIAIGSGGIFGKGYLKGTQAHLQFLPEHDTDFIFAVIGEELGFMGELILLGLYSFLIIRGFIISYYAQNTFSRLLAGSISLTFFFSVFINIGMVTGILPVVGLPLPLISYGGTSLIILIASFGLLMSIHTHRRLVGK